MFSDLVIAQITDSHLFANIDSCHYGDNVYQNLNRVLVDIKKSNIVDVIIFTGDLTQDHTEASYLNFVNCVSCNEITQPIYFLAGNHDDLKYLNNHLQPLPFNAEKTIEHGDWQIILVNSKGKTPAGYISEEQLTFLEKSIDENKAQLLFMHHHPIDVGYFIDEHGLQNKQVLWALINDLPSVKAIACGHVHQGLTLSPENTGYSKTLYTCPATSIQFDKNKPNVANNGQGAGYRTFVLSKNKQLTTQLHFVD